MAWLLVQPPLGISVARSLSESCYSTAANDLQTSASFSARNSPGRLTISAARTNMVRLIRRTVRPQRIPANTPPVFSSLRPRICQHLLCLATKDDSDRLLAEQWI